MVKSGKPRWVNLAVICIIAIGFLTYVFWDKSRETVPSPILSLEPTPSMATTTKTPLYTPTPASGDASASNTESAASPTPVPSPVKDADLNPLRKTVEESMPKASLIREQAIKDPHTTPAASLEFATMVGNLEKDSIGNENDSKNLMTELESCGATRNPELKNPSIQAVCLETARDLQEKWPSLKTRFDDLMKRADPRAAAIARTTN